MLIKQIKSLFRKNEVGHEYWIKLNKIHITRDFKASHIGKAKYKRKWKFYRKNGYCESKIVLDRNFTLINGYSSYKIYRAAEGIECKVPAWFVK